MSSYEKRGFWVSGDVIPHALLDDAAEAARRWYDGDRDAVLPFSDGFSRWTPSDGPDVVRNDEFVSLQSNGIARLALYSVIGEIAARLARTTQIRLLDDQLIYKPPAKDPENTTTAIGWHADSAYWPTCSSSRLLTAWIPFQDMDDEKGTLIVLDGSHRWSEISDARFFRTPTSTASRRAYCAKGLQRNVFLCGSGGARSVFTTAPRSTRAFRIAAVRHASLWPSTFRIGTTGTSARLGRNGERLQIFDEKLCRRLPTGDPDFADPAVFPAMWPAEP